MKIAIGAALIAALMLTAWAFAAKPAQADTCCTPYLNGYRCHKC